MDKIRNKHGLWLELASFSVIDLSDMSHKQSCVEFGIQLKQLDCFVRSRGGQND